MPDGNGDRTKVAELPLADPVIVADLFATGLAKLEHRGEYVRLTFWTDHLVFGDGNGRPERIIVARIVMPPSALIELAERLLVEHFGGRIS
jgi:hypothetical protein